MHFPNSRNDKKCHYSADFSSAMRITAPRDGIAKMKIRRDGAEKLRDAGRHVTLHQNDVSRVQVSLAVLCENNLCLNALSKKATPSTRSGTGRTISCPTELWCEQSFSKMKIIKNYLRTSMGNQRLSDLTIFTVERDIEIDEFSASHANRRIHLCWSSSSTLFQRY